MQYLEQTAEGSADVGLDRLLPLTLQLVHCVYKLLQYLHPEEDTDILLSFSLSSLTCPGSPILINLSVLTRPG